MSSATYLLEHFYYGQLVHSGQPVGEPRLLAVSPGLSKRLPERAVERVSLPPLPDSDKGAWALVRGRHRQIPFLLVQSHRGRAGQRMSHYIIIPPDVLKAFGGNLEALMTVVDDELPTYTQLGLPLAPLLLPHAAPPTIEAQIDNVLELMTITRNRIDLIEPLLAAIVEGIQLIIVNAPPELRLRVTFVEGLLALLPPSARFGVTFTTHSLLSTDIDVQIRFFGDYPPPDQTVVFNWANAEVSGAKVSDDYSRYIISQLRLDAEQVIEHNTAMAAIAGWRLNEGDKLGDALSYASKRLRMDEALRNNQPVDKDDVSRVLAQDPTLTDELRGLYAWHLLKFSLAMEDIEQTKPVAGSAHSDNVLAGDILQQMRQAINRGQADLVYATLVGWITDPDGPEDPAWIDLAHEAALRRLQTLVEDRAIREINRFLRNLQVVDPEVAIHRAVPGIIEVTLPLITEDSTLAQELFLLAVKYLDAQAVTRIMRVTAFRRQLPPQVRRLWGHITAEETTAAPEGLLIQSARSFGLDWEPAVLVRFVELTVKAARFELVDTKTLNALLKIVLSPTRKRYERVLSEILTALESTALAVLEPPGLRILLQMRLALGDYAELGRQLDRQAEELYDGDVQSDYLEVVRYVFSRTPVPPDEIPGMLQAIERAGVKSIALLVASVSVLRRQQGSPELDQIAEQAIEQLITQRHLLEVIPLRAVLTLVEYAARREDASAVRRAASLMIYAAPEQGIDAIPLMAEVFKNMTWDTQLRRSAMHLLRVYVRRLDRELSQRAIAYFGRELGSHVHQALMATYILKQFMGGVEFTTYAQHIHAAASLLQELYVYGQKASTVERLTQELESLPDELSAPQRQELAVRTLSLAKSIVQLGAAYRSTIPGDEPAYIGRLLGGQVDPRSALDVMRVISGYLANGRRFDMERMRPSRARILGERTSKELLDDLTAADEVTGHALRACPPEKPLRLSSKEIYAEVRSILRELAVDGENEILVELAADLQRLVMSVRAIESTGDPEAVGDSNLGRKIDDGRQAPESALEFLRFLHGYYLRS